VDAGTPIVDLSTAVGTGTTANPSDGGPAASQASSPTAAAPAQPETAAGPSTTGSTDYGSTADNSAAKNTGSDNTATNGTTADNFALLAYALRRPGGGDDTAGSGTTADNSGNATDSGTTADRSSGSTDNSVPADDSTSSSDSTDGTQPVSDNQIDPVHVAQASSIIIRGTAGDKGQTNGDGGNSSSLGDSGPADSASGHGNVLESAHLPSHGPVVAGTQPAGANEVAGDFGNEVQNGEVTADKSAQTGAGLKVEESLAVVINSSGAGAQRSPSAVDLVAGDAQAGGADSVVGAPDGNAASGGAAEVVQTADATHGLAARSSLEGATADSLSAEATGAQGWLASINLSALDLGLQQFLHELDAAGHKVTKSPVLLGVSSWVLTAAVAATALEVGRRQLKQSPRRLLWAAACKEGAWPLFPGLAPPPEEE
jgi:hypothetical protein